MRASRLLGILILLQLRGRMAGRDLAAEFEVTERTIYRDIDALSAAGVPVYGDRGPGGGFQLLDGYRTKLTGLAADEAEAMLMISLPSAASALGLGSAASRAKRKLLAALHPPSLEGAGRLGERIHLDPVEWYHAEQAAPFLPDLARAVLDSRQATIRYASWTSERDWAIDPLGLVMKAGAWYCVARSGNRTMTFKVANILTCTISETGFDRPTDFDLRAYWTSSLERFEEGLRQCKATLRTTPLGRARLAELGAFAERAIAGEKGIAIIELPIETDEHAARQIAGLGDEVEVIGPESLRQALADLAKQMLGKYADR